MSKKIKLSEVCFGNYFEYNRDNGCSVMIAPSNMQFSVESFNKAYRPAEITEAWLLGLGFTEAIVQGIENDCVAYVFDDVSDAIVLRYDEGYFEVRINGSYVIPVEHVHHLQNIFSANFGVELKVENV